MADRLGRSVAELRASLSQDEWVKWQVWHGRKAQRAELAQKMAKHERR